MYLKATLVTIVGWFIGMVLDANIDFGDPMGFLSLRILLPMVSTRDEFEHALYCKNACNVRQCVIYYQCKMISNRKEWPSATPYALLGENFSVRRDGFAGKADRSPRRGTGKAFV